MPNTKSATQSKSSQVRALLATGMDAASIAKKVGCSTNLVYVVKSTAGGAKGRRGRGGKKRKARRQTSASPNLHGVEGILAAVQNSERERAQLRAALEKIQSVIDGALA